jgi:hypothetical protein
MTANHGLRPKILENLIGVPFLGPKREERRRPLLEASCVLATGRVELRLHAGPRALRFRPGLGDFRLRGRRAYMPTMSTNLDRSRSACGVGRCAVAYGA